jgi:type IV pilus assembly protein PilB
MSINPQVEFAGPQAPAPSSSADQMPTEAAAPGLTAPRHRGHSHGFTSDMLVELGYVSQERLQKAIEEARLEGSPPEVLLLERGEVNGDQLSRAIAERYGLDHVDLSIYQVDMAATVLFPLNMARRYKALPIGFVDRHTLLVAAVDPSNVLALDDIQLATGLDCRLAVAAEDDLEAVLARLNTLQSATTEAIIEDQARLEAEEAEELEAASELQASAEDGPVIKLVYSVLGQAVNERASDIHLEPEEGEMRIRFRIDGVLKEATRVPRRMISAVISRIKIMSDLDIAEKRLPQDGRVSVTIDERRVDLRVTTLPTQRGEGATIRILDQENTSRSLDVLGMDPETRHRFETAFRRPYGAILVTGPTGSGKSTTLYAALQDLNRVEKKIITIEDPVEYQMPGINQLNVSRKAGLDFAAGLRSMLRADPDIVMVGEIRDAETARIAIEAALTGHLMLSTLHTNDAPGAIARLNKMGVETFLTASAIDCVVAQRLARKLCSHCKREATIGAGQLREAGFNAEEDVTTFEPVGCSRCGGTGYAGRVGIYSLMSVDEGLKEMIVSQASEAELASAAKRSGMVTLREDGLTKVRDGSTSFEEILRVTA